VHSRKRNQLGIDRAKKLVRSFTNINVLNKLEAISKGCVSWDLEMMMN
jgi:hypothetical protein